MKIYFILVEPAVPENIGASARAIKTMGFNNLRMVNPVNHLDEKAYWLAHGSKDILDNAGIFSSFDQAISDLDFTIGTTSKKRRIANDFYSPEEALNIISNKTGSIKSLGIIFGREESGLSNTELKKCDLLSSIPMQNKYPSLNLSQAVMLYAYALSSIRLCVDRKNEETISTESYCIVNKKVRKILEDLGIQKDSNIFNRITERLSAINTDDSNLINSICNEYLKKYHTE